MKTDLKVLLISPNTEKQPQPVYPLGLEYIRAACNTAGFNTLLVDCNLLTNITSELITITKDFKPDFTLMSLRNVDSTESVETRFYIPDIKKVVDTIRLSSDSPIIIGGSGFSLFPEEILKITGADYGVIASGEKLLPDLLTKLTNKLNIEEIPGLVYRTNHNQPEIIANPPSPCPPPIKLTERTEELVQFYWNNGGLLNIQVNGGEARSL